MTEPEHDHFPPGVAERLKFYVYRLIDPRNGETFYVGKGRCDRVFHHARGEVKALAKDPDKDEVDAKIQRIREINAAGFSVAHVIHRHGIDDRRVAHEIEAALIDAYPGLTNKVAGYGSDEFGVAHSREIIERYEARPFEAKHKLLLISIGVSIAGEKQLSIYDATRYAWKISPGRANQAEYVLAHNRGVVVGVFKPSIPWIKATPQNFPTLSSEERVGRWGFNGTDAAPSIRAQYFRKRVPDKYRKRGAANPVRFTF